MAGNFPLVEISTAQAAELLGASLPTVRTLLTNQTLVGRQVPRRSRFAWRVDRASVEAHLATHGRYDQGPRDKRARLDRLEAEVASLRGLHEAGPAKTSPPADLLAERDDLRARIVNLEDALVRTRAAVELQRQADEERAAVVEHLAAALQAGERADALRRRAVAELDEAVAGFTRPGHAGDVRL